MVAEIARQIDNRDLRILALLAAQKLQRVVR
jgi:hypothetical protein